MKKLIIILAAFASCTKPGAYKIAPITATGVDTVRFTHDTTMAGLSKVVYLDTTRGVPSVAIISSDSVLAIAAPAGVTAYFDHTPTNRASVSYTVDALNRKCFKISFR